MEKAYLKYSFSTAEADRDLLLANLDLLGFDGFEETPAGWTAYRRPDQNAEAIEEALRQLAARIPFSYATETVPDQNWNALWEAGFQPIRVGNFCGVRADFHAPLTDVQYEIVINPKMAFGTGHHATTYMMIAAMEDLPLTGKKVLDYGCGTGILAILAARMGAATVHAVDIEQDAYENSLENCRTNGAADVYVVHGTLAQMKDTDYEIILANINRNVILESLPALFKQLSADGWLLLSGILTEDQAILLEAARRHHFQHYRTEERTGWLSILLKKV